MRGTSIPSLIRTTDVGGGKPRGAWKTLSGSVLAAFVVLLFAAAAPAQEPGLADRYRLGPKDLLEIKVLEVAQLNVERRISENGSINLPLLEEIPVEGLTEEQVSDRIKALLESKYVQHATVSVLVKEFRSKPISVLGAVKQPGYLAVSPRMNLLDAITSAGGVTEGHGSKVIIVRRATNGLSDQIEIPLVDLMEKMEPDANIPVFANDVIRVPIAPEITVYFLGEVKAAGALTFKGVERATLVEAVARIGGLSDRASSTVTVKRKDVFGRFIEKEVNYKRILAGKDPDFDLASGDIIIVKESFF